MVNVEKYDQIEQKWNLLYVSYCLLYFFLLYFTHFFFFLNKKPKKRKNFHHFLLHRLVWLGRKEKVVPYMKLLTTICWGFICFILFSVCVWLTNDSDSWKEMSLCAFHMNFCALGASHGESSLVSIQEKADVSKTRCKKVNQNFKNTGNKSIIMMPSQARLVIKPTGVLKVL